MKILRLFIVVLSLFSVLLMPFNVMATIETLTVDAEGAHTDGAYVGGAGTFVNMQSDDDDTTDLNIVGTLATPLRHTYSFTNSAVTSIANVTLGYRVRYMSAGDSHIKAYATVGGVDYYLDTVEITDVAYSTNTFVWSVNPETGLEWTLAQINASEFGLEFLGTYRWTYAYIHVNYSTASYATVVTHDATDKGLTFATMNGEVTDYGADNVDNRGFVWDVASVPTNPGDVAPAASGYANNYAPACDMTTGTYNYSAAVLVANTAYWYRAVVHNGAGWVYGEERQFRTISTPTVTLNDETNVSSVSAQLNAIITYYGEQLCDVRFGWENVSRAANADLYANHSPWVNDTYATGDNVAVTITGLAATTTYFFNVQVRNDQGTVQGVELDFTTPAAALTPPADLYAKPEMTALNLSWTKYQNATGTLIRYSYATYPTTTTEGAQAYPPAGDSGSGNSYRLTGLTSGRTVYISAWSFANGAFSAAYTTQISTTLAANATDSVTALPQAKEIEKWMVEPSNANLQKLPGHAIVASVATTYQMPETSLWFILGITFAVAFAGFAWGVDNNHSPMAAMVGLCIGLGGGIAAGIYAGWMLFLVILIAIGSLIIATRL